MKKILILFALISAGVCARAQVRLIYEPSFIILGADDTLNVNKRDGIAAMTITVPTGATDSTWVRGKQIILDGYISGWVHIPPGMSYPLGYNDAMRIDSLTIVSKSKTWITVTPKKW